MLNKTDLLNAIASKNRGLNATPTDRQVIASMIARVEDRNPTPDPLSATELLGGDWLLRYTTSQELLRIDNIPLAKLGNIYQCIRTDSARLYNIAEINGLAYLSGLVTVVASFTPAEAPPLSQLAQSSASTVTTLSTRKVNVAFQRSVIGLQSILGYRSPAQFIPMLEANAKLPPLKTIDFSISPNREPGWVDITYLDADMRIGRGNQGNLFVLTKVTS